MSRRAQNSLRLGMAALSVAVAAFTAGCPGIGSVSGDVPIVIGARRTPSPAPTATPVPVATPQASASPAAGLSPSPGTSPAPTASPTPVPTPTPQATPVSETSVGLDVRTLDMAANSWAPHTPMTLARQGLVAVDGGDRLFVFTGDGSLTDETYTFSSGRWQRYRSAFGGLGGGTNLYFAGAAMIDSTVAIIGGMSGDEWGANYTGLALPTRDNLQAPRTPDYPSALLELGGTPVYAMGVAALDGKLYVAGGRDLSSVKNACYVFTTLSDPKPSAPLTTQRLAQPIAPLRLSRAGLGLAALNGRLYAIGGYTLKDTMADVPAPDTTVQVYNPATNAWLVSGEPGGPAPMPSKRYGFAVAAMSGRIYVVGGKNEFGATLRTVEAFDPLANKWTTLAPMPTARSILALVPHQGRLYAIGGADAMGRASRVVEVYAP